MDDIRDIIDKLEEIKRMRDRFSPDKIIKNCLEFFNEKMNLLIIDIENSIEKGEILDDKGQLQNVINHWKEKKGWELINSRITGDIDEENKIRTNKSVS